MTETRNTDQFIDCTIEPFMLAESVPATPLEDLMDLEAARRALDEGGPRIDWVLMRRWLGLGLVVLTLAGCVSGPRAYMVRADQMRQVTKPLNRIGSEAKVQVESVCAASSANMQTFCTTLRNLYRFTLKLADGIDDLMNAADAENKQALDLEKVLSAGFKVLDLMTEEEATVSRVASKGDR